MIKKIIVAILIFFGFYACYVYFSFPSVNISIYCIETKVTKIKLCRENPNFVALEDVSKNLINAILVAEDISFFQHKGFDSHEIKKSFFTNLKRFRLARGGSTITQQMIKNVYLTSEKTFVRKLHEAYLTQKIEKAITKNRILEMYINVIEFGPQLYGIQRASHYYFNKEPYNLTVLESAFLAFLLPNPKVYKSSYDKGELTVFAEKRLKDIIKKMYFYKMISESQWQQATGNLSSFPWRNFREEEQWTEENQQEDGFNQ